MFFSSSSVSFVFMFWMYASQLSTFLPPGFGLVSAVPSNLFGGDGTVEFKPNAENDDKSLFEELLKTVQTLERKYHANGENSGTSNNVEDTVKKIIQKYSKSLTDRMTSLEASADGAKQQSGSLSSDDISKINKLAENVANLASKLKQETTKEEERLRGLQKRTEVKCDYSHTENGVFKYTDMAAGSGSVITCNTDFNYCGTKTSATCSDNGSWTGYDGKCAQSAWRQKTLHHELPCGIKVGTKIIVQGTPTHAKVITLNLVTNELGTIMHMSIRFKYSDMTKGVLFSSRNKRGNWESRFKVFKDFLFQVNKKFILVISVTKAAYKITVQVEGSKRVAEYEFQHRHDISTVKYLAVLHDVKDVSVQYMY